MYLPITCYYCDFGYCKCNIVIAVVVVNVVIVPYDEYTLYC